MGPDLRRGDDGVCDLSLAVPSYRRRPVSTVSCIPYLHTFTGLPRKLVFARNDKRAIRHISVWRCYFSLAWGGKIYIMWCCGLVAQWLERSAHNALVVGSSPT